MASSGDSNPAPTKFCANHPDRPSTYVCQKFDLGFCDECCKCPHESSVCNFRTQCLIRATCMEGED